MPTLAATHEPTRSTRDPASRIVAITAHAWNISPGSKRAPARHAPRAHGTAALHIFGERLRNLGNLRFSDSPDAL